MLFEVRACFAAHCSEGRPTFATPVARSDIALTYVLRQVTSYAEDAARHPHWMNTSADVQTLRRRTRNSRQKIQAALPDPVCSASQEKGETEATPIWVFSEPTARKTSHHCTQTSQGVPVRHSAADPDLRESDHDPEGDQPPWQDPYLGLLRFASQRKGLTSDRGPPRPRRRHSRR